MNWISVLERLPALNENVLVYQQSNGTMEIAAIVDVSWKGEPDKPPRFIDRESYVEHELVTHWAALIPPEA